MTPLTAPPQLNKSDFVPFELFARETLWHETIRAKLQGLIDTTQFDSFSRCGHEPLYRTCRCCGRVKIFTHRCSIKWCPCCNWQITRRRQMIIKAWADKMVSAKHVVTTQKNFPILTGKKFREHTRNLARLRRQKVFRNLRGGCVSVETTNEGQGWHVHAHWFVDCDWIDPGELAVAWGKLVGQEFAIVKVKDARAKDYAHEVAKYVCKGSEMATWPAEQILEFVTAVHRRRFFFAFGELTKKRKEVEDRLDALKNDPAECECGASDFLFESERQATINEIRKERHR